ncbi:YciI family protein [Dongia sp.]|uniref:YciI family protein n=1 Tax=Dongia sp. TaxID=1977262 RepID=UPI0035AFC079
MIYAVLFEDDFARAVEVRRRFMPEHLAFLERHGDRILAAGPLCDPAGEPAGGLWLVDAEHAENVTALIESDPFWPAGLRRSHRILPWQRVFNQGQVLIPRPAGANKKPSPVAEGGS